jgi:hypothetical protein
MNRILELGRALKNAFVNFLQKIEESSFFERSVLKWESLDPRYQKRYLAFLNFAAYLFVILVFAWPPFIVLTERMKLSKFKDLQSEIRSLALTPEIVKKPAAAPMGWLTYPIATIDEFETSLELFLANLGIPLSSGEYKRTGNDMNLVFEDLTIRQILVFVYQIDGWNPALKLNSLSLQNSKSNKVLMRLEANLKYDPSSASTFTSAGGEGYRSGGPVGFQESKNVSTFIPPSSDGNATSGRNENVPSSPNYDTENDGMPPPGDYLPPPPPPGMSYEEE